MWLDLQCKYLQSLPATLWQSNCEWLLAACRLVVAQPEALNPGRGEAVTSDPSEAGPCHGLVCHPAPWLYWGLTSLHRLPSRPTAATWWSANWILNQLRDQEGGNDSITATFISIRLNHSNLQTLDCDLAPDKEIISVKSRTEILIRTEIRRNLAGGNSQRGAGRLEEWEKCLNHLLMSLLEPNRSEIQKVCKLFKATLKEQFTPKLEFSHYIVAHALMESRVKQNSVAAFS